NVRSAPAIVCRETINSAKGRTVLILQVDMTSSLGRLSANTIQHGAVDRENSSIFRDQSGRICLAGRDVEQDGFGELSRRHVPSVQLAILTIDQYALGCRIDRGGIDTPLPHGIRMPWAWIRSRPGNR